MVNNMNPQDIFDFKIVDNFPGYNSANDKTRLSPGFLIRGSKNVYKKVSGTLASRPGLKRRGSEDSTNGGVKSSYEWATSVGTTRPLRVANGKLQVESDIVSSGTYVWYDLLLTSTLEQLAGTYTRFSFATWWDSDDKSDRLIMVRGDSNLLYWSGGMALVDSATANTITIQGTDTIAELGFANTLTAEKKLIIGGAEYTYTGISGNDFTGVTPDPSALTQNSVIIQSVLSKAGGADGDMFPADYIADFIKIIENQLMVFSLSSRTIYIGASTTAGGVLGFLNFTNAGSLIPGDPDTIVLDSLPTAVGEKDGKVCIFGGTADLYIVTPNFNLPVSFDNEYVTWKVEKKVLPELNAALAYEFVGNFSDYLIWLDQKNQLRALGSFTNESFIKPVSLSLPVQIELSEDDFTDGHLRVIEDTVYITAPTTGRDWMYTIRDTVNNDGSVSSEKFWHAPQVRGIQRFAVINGIIHGHSNVNPQIFQVWDTNQWFDDGFTDGNGRLEEIPYVWVMRFAYQSHNRPEGRVTFDRVYWEGYMPQGVDVRGNIYFDYQGAQAIREVEISNEDNLAHFYTGLSPSSIGDGFLGQNPLGDGIIDESSEQSTVPKFRDITNVANPLNCFEYSLEIFSLEIDGRFELLRFGPNIRLSSETPAFLGKPMEQE